MGGRIMAEFFPKWFVTLDGSVGGFGVDNVSFTGSALGTVGYRTTLFGVPSSVEAGYKALSVNVDKRNPDSRCNHERAIHRADGVLVKARLRKLQQQGKTTTKLYLAMAGLTGNCWVLGSTATR